MMKNFFNQIEKIQDEINSYMWCDMHEMEYDIDEGNA